MRIMIVNTDYPAFVRWLYRTHPGLERRPYAEQLRVRMESLFGHADFWSSALRRLGHEAWDVLMNVEPLQKRWAREHGVRFSRGELRVGRRAGFLPWPVRRADARWMSEILEAQVRTYRPDVLYVNAIEAVDAGLLRRLRGTYDLAVGQHAAPLDAQDLSAYDLMLSSLPNLVERFRRDGLRSEYFRLGFGERVLERLGAARRRYDVVFVGGLTGPHARGTQVLERLCRALDVAVFGYGAERLPVDSAVRAAYRGPVWGVDMYQALRDARLVFNRHIDVAGDFANNMRLYEATGVGTALLTEAGRNLAELFEPDREVITYRDADECLERARHYLSHEAQREALAQAGQRRTLREHTWAQRMEELTEILERCLRGKRHASGLVVRGAARCGRTDQGSTGVAVGTQGSPAATART